MNETIIKANRRKQFRVEIAPVAKLTEGQEDAIADFICYHIGLPDMQRRRLEIGEICAEVNPKPEPDPVEIERLAIMEQMEELQVRLTALEATR